MNTATLPPMLRRPEKPRNWDAPGTRWLPMEMWQQHQLSHILMQFGPGVQQLIFIGGWDAAHTPPRAWWLEPASAGIRGERLSLDPAQCRYHIGNHHIDVRMSAVWFGDASDVAACREAYNRLNGILRGAFGPGVHCMGTPGRTGLDLLERSLPQGVSYPTIPAGLDEVIRHNIGQGRMEFCAPAGLGTVDELLSLDARWMYAACVKDLPRGPVLHVQGADARRRGFVAYQHAFYRIVFRVPDDWAFIGLLPAWDAKAERTIFPTRNTSPASWYETIVAEPELRVAVENGWQVKTCEAWIFNPYEEKIPDPARTWIDKLRNLRERQTGDLVAAALRNIANHTVGQWHRTARREPQMTPVGQVALIPADAEDVAPYPSLDAIEHWEWYKPAKLHPDQMKYMHPEWSAYVWSRARARLASRALTYQREIGGAIVAFRNDAIVVSADPHIPDDGKIGTFREKRRWLRGLALPDGTIWYGSVPRDELHYRQLLGAEEHDNGE